MLATAAVFAGAVAFAGSTPVLADPFDDVFELEGNAVDDASFPDFPPDDAENIYQEHLGPPGATSAIESDFNEDGDDPPVYTGGAQDMTWFDTGGSKDINDISEWVCDDGDVSPDKDELLDTGIGVFRDEFDRLILAFFADRFASNGDAQIGIWFNQDGTVSCDPSLNENFSGAHITGDLLLLSNFTNGGAIERVDVVLWDPPSAPLCPDGTADGGIDPMACEAAFGAGIAGVDIPEGGCSGSDDSYGNLDPGECGDSNLRVIFIGTDCETSSDDALACATVNREGDNAAAPWAYQAKELKSGPNQAFQTYVPGAYFEGAVCLEGPGCIFPAAETCFTTVLFETRSSQSYDAQLKDYSANTLELCSIDVTKNGDPLSKVGDSVDYTITVLNDGSLTLHKESILDTLLGDLSGEAGCNGDLEPDESCTINVSRTVLGTDPDPLPNTVTVVYDSKIDLTGDEVTDADDHSVNLFQPAIALDKTCDATLSKVGDDVNCTITLSNNSSADTPALSCTATDSMQGQVFNGILPLGDTPIQYSFSVPSGADPLVNTASMTCSPAGFPNVLEASDGHTINLFQPAIAVAKTGDALSKVGDDVNYTITLSNNSSADTPALNCTANDSLLGSVFSGVLPLGDTVLTPSRTVLGTDPDPLVNTVTLTCSPAGFPNVLEASASHSTNLFQPAIAAAKTGDALSKVGDSVDYTITLSNNSSADTPAMNCTANDSLLGSVFSGVLPLGDTVLTPSRTVLGTDPDPLVNTVTLTCSPAGFPNVLEASASHSTNLFQPAVAAAKTGDALSKVGDPVNYTFTLSNNSSADTPAMSCTATDSLLGPVFSGVLPLGDTVVNQSRTVQAGDPDPLGNTVSMTCSIAGFPNMLGASASHSTNLFQPDVQVIKTGPDSAARGDTITYNFVINNLSSADTPDLILDSVTDTIIGDLTAAASAAGCGTLGFGGTCNFTADYTLQFDDPSPLVNVVTVHYSPDGFTNDVTDDDDHSVNIPVLGCTPGFWQGGAGSQQWDQTNDPDWTGLGTNPFVHTTLFNGFFNAVTNPRLIGLTMYKLVSMGGTSDNARKAARNMVAAYLNESAFPEDFPAESLAQLEADWYAAVAGGDAALLAFHIQVGAWNNPAEPGFCPLP
jgi:uncharacterized repeat protein (TIGR01451 family)